MVLFLQIFTLSAGFFSEFFIEGDDFPKFFSPRDEVNSLKNDQSFDSLVGSHFSGTGYHISRKNYIGVFREKFLKDMQEFFKKCERILLIFVFDLGFSGFYSIYLRFYFFHKNFESLLGNLIVHIEFFEIVFFDSESMECHYPSDKIGKAIFLISYERVEKFLGFSHLFPIFPHKKIMFLFGNVFFGGESFDFRQDFYEHTHSSLDKFHFFNLVKFVDFKIPHKRDNGGCLDEGCENNAPDGQCKDKISHTDIEIPSGNGKIFGDEKHHNDGKSSSETPPRKHMLPGKGNVFFPFHPIERSYDPIDTQSSRSHNDENRENNRENHNTPLDMKRYDHNTDEEKYERIRHESEKTPKFLHRFLHLRTDFIPSVISYHHSGDGRRDNSGNWNDEMIDDLRKYEGRMCKYESEHYLEELHILDPFYGFREYNPGESSENHTNGYHEEK